MSIVNYLLVWAHLGTAVLAIGHAVLHQRQARGAALWCIIVLMVPWLGPVLYLLLGINRIPRRTRARPVPTLGDFKWSVGNRVEPLEGGDIAYPTMLAAIDAAKASVHLATYIFDDDRIGARFREALERAVKRGLRVRVLIDAVGARYSRPPIVGSLIAAGIPTARFLPSVSPWRWPYANLRNHRKLLIVDDELGFLGGMNIREACMLSLEPAEPTRDLHFRVEGPVVADMQRLFSSDWAFATGEDLPAPAHLEAASDGGAEARLVSGGPDLSDEPIRWLTLSTLVRASSRVRIVTPYFVPDEDVVTALCAASAAGIRISVIMPSVNNLRLVSWASRGTWVPLLQRGIELWLTAPPFDHSKLMLVDDQRAVVGSANWDERSFRLNFECNLECRDPELVRQLDEAIDRRLASARQVTLEEMNQRSLPHRLRDRLAWLTLPYL